MKEEDFFTSLNVFDYPDLPGERKGVCECYECGRQIYKGEYIVRDAFGEIICSDCFAYFKPDDVIDLLNIDYDAEELYEKLGGKWEEV